MKGRDTVNQSDLPAVSISRLRAPGFVTAETTVTTIRLGDVEANVGLILRMFPNVGSLTCLVRNAATVVDPADPRAKAARFA
jgi:hypothetical protein